MCQKSFAEFAPEGANKVIFGRGVYLDENTSQAASVEFVRQGRRNYAHSGLQSLAENPLRGFSTVSKIRPAAG